MFHIHESNAGAGREIERSHAGAVDIDGQIHEGWTVRLLMCRHAEGGHTVLGEAFVAEAIELSLAGDARQLSFKFRQIQRHARV